MQKLITFIVAIMTSCATATVGYDHGADAGLEHTDEHLYRTRVHVLGLAGWEAQGMYARRLLIYTHGPDLNTPIDLHGDFPSGTTIPCDDDVRSVMAVITDLKGNNETTVPLEFTQVWLDDDGQPMPDEAVVLGKPEGWGDEPVRYSRVRLYHRDGPYLDITDRYPALEPFVPGAVVHTYQGVTGVAAELASHDPDLDGTLMALEFTKADGQD